VRIVFTSGDLDFSGMIASALSEDGDIEVAGIIYDNGVPSRRPLKPTPESKLSRLAMHARLAARVPALYGPRLLSRIGMRGYDAYSRFRRSEERTLAAVARHTGSAADGYVLRNWRRFSLLNEVAEKCNVPFYCVDNVNSESAVAALSELRPDILVSLGNRILKPHVLRIPTYGTLNGHSSLLPRYRGSATEFWQLAFGETKTGVTIHWMAEGLDSGPILAQAEWPIEPGTNHVELRILSQFRRVDPWRRALRLAAQGHAGQPQGISDTPTFRRPELRHLYDYYVLGKQLSASDLALQQQSAMPRR
jgi:folate-dependent phosphoribosylglycinamide formyltransferase PurN